jgi:coronin-1B/1C/6
VHAILGRRNELPVLGRKGVGYVSMFPLKLNHPDNPSDGNIRYFEYENDKFEYLSEYKSADPQRGIAFLPKRGINLHENEIMRAYKTVNDSLIEPVHFIVPRRAEIFQEDIYPPTTGLKPGVSGAEWFEGKTAAPPKISLESVYDGKEPKEMPQDYKSAKVETPITSPPPTKTEAPKPKAAPAPAPEPVRPTKLEDNKASMSAMASRFADKDAEEESSDEDDASSFEEVPKPIERPVSVAKAPEKKPEPTRAPAPASPTKSTPTAAPSKPNPSTAPAPVAALSRPAEPSRTPSGSLWSKTADAPQEASSTATLAPASGSATTPTGPAEGLKAHLADLKEQNLRILSLLEQQSRALGRQTDQIMYLSEEVAKMKAKGGDVAPSGNKELEEKIRRLELELEEARSA